MKSVVLLRRAYNRAAFRALLVGLCTVSANSVLGQTTYYWDTNPGTAAAGNNVREGGAGTWNTTTANFTTSVTDSNTVNHNVWSSAAPPVGVGTSGTDRVVFGGAAGGAIELDPFPIGGQIPGSTVVAVNSLSFETSGYTLQGLNSFRFLGTTPGVAVSPGITATINVLIGGTSNLTKSDTGQLTLGGLNTYTGVTTIAGGVLSVATLANGGSNSGIGASSNASSNLVLNGGTLRYTGGAVSVDRAFTLGTAGGTIETNGTAGALNLTSTGATALAGTNTPRTLTLAGTNTARNTYSGILGNNGTGATSLTKTGAGTWVLGNANSYTGVTTITTGVLSVASLANGGVSSSVGASSNAASNLVINGTLQYTGAGADTDRGFSIDSTAATIESSGSGALRLTSTAPTAFITTNAARTLILSGSNTGNNTYAGVLTNNGTGTTSLTKAGAGSWILSGLNTHTGTTNISRGTLTLNTNTGSITGPVSLGGSTFNLDNTGAAAAVTESIGTLTFGSGGDSTVNIARTVDQNQAVTFGSLGTRAAGSTGNFVNSGGGNGTGNGFFITGRAAGFIDQGTFFGGNNYAAMNALGTFVRGINYGPDGNSSSTTSTVAALPAGANALVSGAGAVTAQTTATISTLQLTNANDFALAAGATLTVNGILKSGGAAGGSITGGTGIQASSNAELVIRTDLASDTLTIATPILAVGTNRLTKSGAGTLSLNSANAYTGVTTVNSGVLSVSNLANGGTSSGIGSSSNAAGNLVLNGGALRYTGGTVSTDRNFTLGVEGGTIDASGSGALTLSTTGSPTLTGTNVERTLTLSGTNTGNNTYAGILGNNGTGATSLTKTGDGTWVLTGTNTYSGATTINGGVLSIGSNANLGAPGTGAALNLNNGTLRATTTLGLWNNNAGTNDRNVVLSGVGGTFDVTGAFNTLSISGMISGSGGLTKTGPGFLEIRQATHTGPTNVNAGTLSLGAEVNPVNSDLNVGSSGTVNLNGFNNAFGSLAGSGVVTNTGAIATLTVGALNGSSSFSGRLTNESSGLSLNKVGSGTLTLTGANNDYTGTTTISAGTLALTGTGAVPASTQLSISGATGRLDISGIAGTTSTVATLSGATGSTVALGGKSLMMSSGISNDEFTYAGTIGGTGGLLKEGPSVQIFTGASTFSGPTVITGGAILANNLSGSALGTSNVTVSAIGSIDPLLEPVTLGGTGSISGIVTLANGGTLAPGASVGTLGIGGANGTGRLEIEFDSSLGIFDRLNVAGALNLDNFALNFTDLAIAPGTLTSQNYVFATYGSLTGTTRTFSSISGTPSGYLLNYAFNGNNVALVAVPEPGSLALIVVAGLSGVWYRRKQQQVVA